MMLSGPPNVFLLDLDQTSTQYKALYSVVEVATGLESSLSGTVEPMTEIHEHILHVQVTGRCLSDATISVSSLWTLKQRYFFILVKGQDGDCEVIGGNLKRSSKDLRSQSTVRFPSEIADAVKRNPARKSVDYPSPVPTHNRHRNTRRSDSKINRAIYSC